VLKKLIRKTFKLHRPQQRRIMMGRLARWFPDLLIEPPMAEVDGQLMTLSRAALIAFIEDQLASGLIQGKVLDVGAGTTSFCRNLLKDTCQYTTCDCFEHENIDVVCDIYQLGSAFAPQSFDTILCLEVLEHLQRPQEAVDQIFSLLKPGGTLLLTTPFNYPIHTTEYTDDYWRFTASGLKQLLKGFSTATITPTGHPRFPYGYCTLAVK
jgi:2-polyprenyl-3-methyl-5-hydroxy-6-metoxy-1,4-benzoquinol methylase